MKKIFERLKSGLAKTHNSIMNKIDGGFSSGPSREELAAMLEEILITADVGVKTSGLIVDGMKSKLRVYEADGLKDYLRDVIFNILKDCQRPLEITEKPYVIMVLGVNGVGKTTTIGKLA